MLAANAMGEEPVTFPDVEWGGQNSCGSGPGRREAPRAQCDGGRGGRHRARWVHGLHLGRSERSQPPFAWASASKAVVSTMLFFAINEGRLSGPDVTVRTYVQQQFPGEDLIAKDVPMTFFQLANAQSGYVLPEAPGDAYVYQRLRIQTVQIPGVRTALWGQSDQARARWPRQIAAPERLGPLQFQDGSLIAIIKGAPRWNATLRDTARLGWFWLNKGRWKEQQLLPEALFDTYARAQVPANLPRSTNNTPERLPQNLVRSGTSIPIRTRPIRITATTGSTTSARMARWSSAGACRSVLCPGQSE